jgi:hypothetical protein
MNARGSIAPFRRALRRRVLQPGCGEPGRLLFSDGSLTVNNDVPAVGRNAITGVAQSFMTAFRDMRLVMDEVLVQRHRIEYHWTLIGTNTGPGGAGHVRFPDQFLCSISTS